jgi:hypothetical protein
MNIDLPGLKKLNKAAVAVWIDAQNATALSLEYHAQYVKALKLNKAAGVAYENVKAKADLLLSQVQQDPDADIGWYTTLHEYQVAADQAAQALPQQRAALIEDMEHNLELVLPGSGADAHADPEGAAAKLDFHPYTRPHPNPNARAPSQPQDSSAPPVEPDEAEAETPWGWIALAAAAVVAVVVRSVGR